jgi:adenosine deaminase
LDESRFRSIGFEAYEKIGDVQGSGLLKSRESLEAACRILCRKAAEHNVKYLELRCSPGNYCLEGLTRGAVVEIIEKELSAQSDFSHGLIFIASRHGQMSRIYEHIELAENLMGVSGDDFPSLRGFDLAGEETAASAATMRAAFLPMMEKCMHLTIHAGEIAPVESIWEAVYHLSAERIGHGLTLKKNPVLMERFRDRGIALEMCPSSNAQIVGFQDNYARANKYEIYPLKEYLDAGLRVTVNTDNPGISRTDFSNELHMAARMAPGGLSIWEILLLIRNGFKAAFVQKSDRQSLLRQAEKQILDLLEEYQGNFLPGPS